ncbi:MAG: M23 family metallopeptidase [Pseudonocardiales bacterium]|nr:M23 family metallopeptidase [Pseudonocardiales bacterium]
MHRLPAPPAASVRGRITVAAVATGAVVAGGQTLVTPLVETPEPLPITLSALAPVAETTTAAFAVDAIGGDQLLPASVMGMDAGTQVDVQNLTKAVEIGQELSRRQALLDSALSFGAPLANLIGDDVFVQPTTGRYTSGFGARWGRSHNGIDIAGPIGTPIYAFTDGVVEKAGPASGFGQWVVLRHADGSKTVYGHVNRFFVREGQQVEAGEEIAEIGNRGFSTGPHLHFEVYDADDTPLDPRPYLQERGVFGF